MLALAAPIQFAAIWPEALILLGGGATLLLGLARGPARRMVPWVSLASFIAAIVVIRGAALFGWPSYQGAAGNGLLLDPLAEFTRISAAIFGVLVTLVSWTQATDEERGEFYSMLLFSIAGLMLVGSSSNLVMLFMALELVSIPTYIMVTLSVSGPRSLEAGTKYFYLGAMAAAVLAFGMSFLYGAAGQAEMNVFATTSIQAALRSPGSLAFGVVSVGLVVTIAGLLFKLAAVPLHFYVADVYQGAGSPVAGMLGFVPKLAGLVAFMKIAQLAGWVTLSGPLFWLLWIIAAVTMTVGNVLALRQTSVKRMLAYSGVAHSGYMLVGLLAGPGLHDNMLSDGAAAVLYYIVIYGIANLGAFALLGVLKARGRECDELRDLAGLLRRNPGAALLMALAMFTLMGLPPTAGFWGKMSLFGSALAASNEALTAGLGTRGWIIALVIIGVVNSAIGAAYYLRVIAAVLLYESDEGAEPQASEAQHIGAILCGMLILFFAFVPTVLLEPGSAATEGLRGAVLFEGEQTHADSAPAPAAAGAATALPASHGESGLEHPPQREPTR